ncbi:MAG: hypothetical protein ACK4VI_04750 [Alphaproteobacteria bacterium]
MKRSYLKNLIVLLLFASVPIFFTSKTAQACCSCNNDVILGVDDDQWFAGGSGTVDVINNHLDAEFNAQQTWMIAVLFEDNILPAMMLMTEQLTVVAMSQVKIFGAFLDAKHQMETQRLFQTLQARAHKDYHPSIGMCEFGSATKSLAASERRGELVAQALSQRSLTRQLGGPNYSATFGPDHDKIGRVNQFKVLFCDPRDHNNGLWHMCTGAPPSSDTGEPQERDQFNRDIDFVSQVDFPLTIENQSATAAGTYESIDLTSSDQSQAFTNVLALASNLYSHDVFIRPAASHLSHPEDGRVGAQLTDMQKTYMNMRSIIAKRSVAESSFNAIVGMKSSGTAGSRDYLVALLRDLGIVDPDAPGSVDQANAEIGRMIGEDPSYYAQMEVLTKKIYQNPTFYTNLYDKPANVLRKGVALQAIGLMQKFDMFKSYLRSEASLSVLLELAVMDLQDSVENRLNVVSSTGEVDIPGPD